MALLGTIGALAAGGSLQAQSILGNIPLAGGAQGVELNTATNRLYVAVGTLNQLVAIDGATNSTLGMLTVGGGPSAVAVNSSTNRVYVASSIANSVTVVDGGTNTIVATVAGLAGPAGLDVNPATGRVYVANYASGSVAIVDGSSNTVIATVPVGPGPRDVAVNPATGRVYVSSAGSAAAPGNSVAVLDGASGAVLANVPVGSRPGVLAVNPATGRVYVVNQGSNSVSVIDGTSNAVLGTVSVGAAPVGLAVNPTTNHVLVTNAGSNDASVIDGATNAVIATLPLGGAGEVAAHPALGRFVVASQSVPFGLTVVQDSAANTVASMSGGVPGALASMPGGVAGALGSVAGGVPGAPGTVVGGVGGVAGGVPGALGSVAGGVPGGAGSVLSAALRPLGPLPISGTVTFNPAVAGQTTINATLQGVSAGVQATLAVPLANGAVTVSCAPAGAAAQATCSQTVSGQPSVGGTVVLAVGGQPVAQGAIASGGAVPLAPVQPVAGVPVQPVGSAPSQALAGALLSPAPGSAVNGVCNFSTGALSGAGVNADCLIQGLAAGQAVSLTLPGSAAATVQCPVAALGGTVTCSQALAMAPSPGSQVMASAAGLPLAQGAVAPGPQPLPAPVRATAGAVLQPAGTPAVDGIANFTPSGGQTAVTAALEGLAPGQQATLQVPLMSGPPAPVICPAASVTGQAVCSQLLNGAPLQGAPLAVVVGGQVVAQGAVVAGPQPGPGGVAPLLGAPMVPPALPPAPPGLLIPPAPGLAPNASAPGGVPIVPEADSVVLVALGLAALAAPAVWRRRTCHGG
jgi:YVTN family beta-propeller protein